MKDFLLPPFLRTERLVLRQLRPEDFPALVKYANNPQVAANIANIPHPFREPDAAFRLSWVVQGFKKRNHFAFALISQESDELIGEASLHLEDHNRAQLGYWLAEPQWDQGLVSEAVAAVVPFGFEKLEVAEIYATTRPDNLASQRVLEKNGFENHGPVGNLLLFRQFAPVG